jgi:pilus assembly protein CpaC
VSLATISSRLLNARLFAIRQPAKAQMKTNLRNLSKRQALASLVCLAFAPAACFGTELAASTPAARASQAAQSPTASRQLAATTAKPVVPSPSLPAELSNEPARIGPSVNAIVGKSTLIRLPEAIERISVGNPAIADVTLVSQREIYLLGKDLGTTNMVVWAKGGRATVIDVQVGSDPALLERELRELMPGEPDIRVKTSADSIVLQGIVADAVKVDHAVEIAAAVPRFRSARRAERSRRRRSPARA